MHKTKYGKVINGVVGVIAVDMVNIDFFSVAVYTAAMLIPD